MIKAEYAHETLRKDQHYPENLLQQQQFAQLEQIFQQVFQQRQHLKARDWERQWIDLPKKLFKNSFIHDGANALKLLQTWKARSPESIYPYLALVHYWESWSNEYRGSNWAASVTDEMWLCAREAQKQLFANALQALARSEDAWVVAAHLLISSARLEEPEWLNKWLIKEHFISHLKHQITPEAQKMADRCGLHEQLPVEIPTHIPDCLKPYRQFKKDLDQPQNEAAFWLKFYLDHSRYGLIPAIDYCYYLLPRWGYSYDDIFHFIQSDWCQHFSELEKNELYFVAWEDDINDNLDAEQKSELKRIISKAEALLKRPLEESDRARVHLRLAHFYRLYDEKSPNVIQHYTAAAPYNIFDCYEIENAITYWYEHAKSSHFLGMIAHHSKKSEASAAILYGLLCQHGWAGVERSPMVSNSWYEYAKQLEAPQPYPDGAYCAFYRVNSVFNEHKDYEPVLNMLHEGSSLGFVYPSFISGYIYSLKDKPWQNDEKELYYDNLAAQQGHFSAAYNMGIYYLNKAMRDDATHPEQDLTESFRLFEKTRQDLYAAHEAGTFSYLELTHDILDIYANRLFNYSYYPHLADQIIPILIEQGHKRNLKATSALASLYIDEKNRPHYFNYNEAVRWCEAGYLQDYENEDVSNALALFELESIKNRVKYNHQTGLISAHDLPGRQDILL